MVATKPPPEEVVKNSSFLIKGDSLTPKQQRIIEQFQSLATELKRVSFTREEALAQYQWLRGRLDRTPKQAEVNTLARMGFCPSYATLTRWGVLKQVREERERSRGPTCNACKLPKPFARYLGASSLWVCRTCYPEITGKSQNKRGICPKCRRGPTLITYRHPEFGNVCESCGRKPRRKQPAISA